MGNCEKIDIFRFQSYFSWLTVKKISNKKPQIKFQSNILSNSSMHEKILPNSRQNWGQEGLSKSKGENWRFMTIELQLVKFRISVFYPL